MFEMAVLSRQVAVLTLGVLYQGRKGMTLTWKVTMKLKLKTWRAG